LLRPVLAEGGRLRPQRYQRLHGQLDLGSGHIVATDIKAPILSVNPVQGGCKAVQSDDATEPELNRGEPRAVAGDPGRVAQRLRGVAARHSLQHHRAEPPGAVVLGRSAGVTPG
jgi:hypothetical protein